MIDINRLFPQGHAVGEAFFNREKERKLLAEAFQNNRHIVLAAPRRYGKSSLIRQVLLETKMPGKRMDLLPATNMHFVQKAIRLCFQDLISTIAPTTKSAKEKLATFVKSLHPKLTLNFLGQQLEVSSVVHSPDNIADLLVSLDAAAKKMNQRVVVCFDEFQQISFLKDTHVIEASIRHAVETSTFVSYIFSGSNRHLLSQMFSTKSRPLYRLCEFMKLGRITADDYFPILLAHAKKRWHSTDDATIVEIMKMTHRHPFYVNALCRILWQQDKFPSVAKVQEAWLEYIDTQGNWISDELAKLSPNQRNILAALSFRPTLEPYSSDFTAITKMGASSIRSCITYLVREDFVFRDERGLYRVLDPAMESWLSRVRYFDFADAVSG